MVFKNTDERIYPYNIDNMTRVNQLNYKSNRSKPLDNTPGITALILNLDKPELIIPLIDALTACKPIFKKLGLTLEVIIGDTGSKDPNILKHYESLCDGFRVMMNLKYHFSNNNNELFDTGIKTSHILLLNNDIIFKTPSDTLINMYETCQNFVGISGPILTYPDGKIQHAGVDYFKIGPLKNLCYHPFHQEDFNLQHPINIFVPAVTGACLMTKTELYYQIGGLDEMYEAECQDVAYCFSAQRLGFKIKLLNAGEIIHLENATRPKGHEHWPDRQRFVRKFGSFLDAIRI